MSKILTNCGELPTPCYLLDEAKLRENGEILAGVQHRTGCKILLAQKAFSAFSVYPMLSEYLAGTTASGLFEARLGAEEMGKFGKQTHVFAPAYKESDFEALCPLCDHMIFNSVSQLARYGARAKAAGVSVGLRLNPECSTQGDHAIYDPCAPGSRLGVTRAAWDAAMTPELDALLDGLHFHTLCEQGAEDFATTLTAFESKFGDLLPGRKWLNLGGGHHITKPGYNIALLEQCITHLQQNYGVTVYLEPGEAVALNAGVLITEVLDKVENSGVTTLILDASAACHMPDVLEMPYRPPLFGSGEAGEKAFTYRLSSYTCLAGDIIGDYSFDAPIEIGDRLTFGDMAIYSMVKNNTFNGIPLPSIWLKKSDGRCELIKKFSYQDFKERLS